MDNKPNLNGDVFIMPKVSDSLLHEPIVLSHDVPTNRIIHHLQDGLVDALKRLGDDCIEIRFKGIQSCEIWRPVVISNVRNISPNSFQCYIIYPEQYARVIYFSDVSSWQPYSLDLGS